MVELCSITGHLSYFGKTQVILIQLFKRKHNMDKVFA